MRYAFIECNLHNCVTVVRNVHIKAAMWRARNRFAHRAGTAPKLAAKWAFPPDHETR